MNIRNPEDILPSDGESWKMVTDDTGLLQTAIRVIKIEKYQRYCLKCGKILPTQIKQHYVHNCEKPDFLL